MPLGDKLRIAFLGPFGTFTEQVVYQVAPTGAVLMSITSAPQVLTTMRHGEADRVVVPIENSIEGGVNATLDSLSHDDPLVVVAEMHVYAVFQLVVLPGTRPKSIRRIGTHPHAWVQCRGWIKETFPGAIYIPTTPTAAATELLSDGDAPFDAALRNAVSVNTHGLETLFTDIANNPGAITRSVLVARPGVVSPPIGADRTTTQVVLPVDKSGVLLTFLEQFSVRGADLPRTESHLSGDGLGSHTFSIDIVGHIREEHARVALAGLHRHSPDVRFMSFCPRVGDARVSIVPDMTDETFRAGRAWVANLLRGEDGMGETAGNAPSQPLA